jgi:hypothetical protein
MPLAIAISMLVQEAAELVERCRPKLESYPSHLEPSAEVTGKKIPKTPELTLAQVFPKLVDTNSASSLATTSLLPSGDNVIEANWLPATDVRVHVCARTGVQISSPKINVNAKHENLSSFIKLFPINVFPLLNPQKEGKNKDEDAVIRRRKFRHPNRLAMPGDHSRTSRSTTWPACPPCRFGRIRESDLRGLKFNWPTKRKVEAIPHSGDALTGLAELAGQPPGPSGRAITGQAFGPKTSAAPERSSGRHRPPGGWTGGSQKADNAIDKCDLCV